MADRVVQLIDKNGDKIFPMGAYEPKDVPDRFYSKLVAQSTDTLVPNGADLNTVEYLKIGNYYQPSSYQTTNNTNMPEKVAFRMEVKTHTALYDDENTTKYCYRVRYFTTYTGVEYRQFVYSNGTAGVFSYGSWVQVVKKNDLLNMVYPVGSIYMSYNNTSPATFLGGTWTAISGRFLLAANSTYAAGSTGGAATHTLTKAQLPSLTGTLPHIWGGENKISGIVTQTTVSGSSPEMYNAGTSNNVAYKISIGSGQAHNNMPPYLAVYMWRRTA